MRRLCLILLMLLAPPALAERRVALVLADEAYRDLRPLSTPVADGLAVQDMLQGLGFEVTVETDRDLRRSRRALEDFALDYAGADVALVYYAGHGVEVGGVNYLLPIDAKAETAAAIASSALPLSEVQAVLAQVAPVGIVLLDACREDPFGGAAGSTGSRAAAPLDDPEAPAPRPGLGRIGRADGVLFAFSAAPGEVASDGSGTHSPFADALLRHFPTPGVELRTALTLVQQDVYDRSRGRQLPYIESGLPRLFFAAETADLAERDRLLLAMADLSPDLRAEVERLAADQDMPLAPLYGAVLTAGLQGKGRDERMQALADSARAYAGFRADLQRLSPDDPKVADLRARAEAALELGEYDNARALLAEAADTDGAARDTLRDNYRARTLSQAQTLALSATAARADLDYPAALTDLAKALPLYAELEGPDLPAPDRAAYADLLWDQGDLYRLTGDSTRALAAYQTWQALAAARRAEAPDNPDWARNHGVALVNVGDLLAARGDIAGAEAAYGQALAVAEDLSARPEAPLKWRHDLFVAKSKLADMAWSRGDPDTALRLHAEGLAVLEALAHDFPDRREIPRDMAVAHDRLGDLRRLNGDFAGARADYEAGLALRRSLVAAEPGNTTYAADLATSQDKIGEILLAAGDIQGALAVLRQELTATDALLQADPTNRGLLRARSGARIKLGDALQKDGQIAAARGSYGAALADRRALAKADPENTDWQGDLATALERLGTLAMLNDQLDAAAAPFAESLEISRNLAARDPLNAEWQRDLAVALDRTGDLSARRMDFPAARQAYEESHAITQRLAASAPDNAERQIDLVTSLVRLSFFADDRRAMLEQARDILIRLQSEGRLDAAQMLWRAMVEKQLKDLGPPP